MDVVECIYSKEAFLGVLAELQEDLRRNPANWENGTLGTFLNALASWVADADGYYQNLGQPKPENINWQFFADAVRAARVYE